MDVIILILLGSFLLVTFVALVDVFFLHKQDKTLVKRVEDSEIITVSKDKMRWYINELTRATKSRKAHKLLDEMEVWLLLDVEL